MTDYSDGLSDFFRRAAKLPLLTAKQEIEFGRRAQRGDVTARNKLVEHNIKLGIKVAKGYRGKGLPFEDLVQHAMLGLHHAANKYDPERGFRFTTYAMWWLHHHLQRAVLNEGATIRLPGHVLVRRARALAALSLAEHENRVITVEELAVIADCKPEQVEEALRAGVVAASLDVPIGQDSEGASYYERIADAHAEDPAVMVDHVENEQLRNALAQLSHDERRVLELRFGFHGHVMSRDDVARRLGMEPHAVGRAQKTGLARLRANILADGDEAAANNGRQGHTLLRPDRGLVPVCSRKQPEVSDHG